MPEGYVRTRPDPAWWKRQLQAGVEFRKREAFETSWRRWRQYYRGQWKSGVLPKNIFFSMLRSIVPRVYFRSPAVSVTPSVPGFLNMAFAQLLGRIDNTLIREMRLKTEMKDTIQDVFLHGTGVLKAGYGALYSPEPGLFGEAPSGARGEQFEFNTNVSANTPWALRASPGSFVVPDGCRRMREARWVAEYFRRPKDDLVRDPRFKIPKDRIPATSLTGDGVAQKSTVDMVDLVEIRDRKYEKVIIMAPYADTDYSILLFEDDALQARGFPYFDLVFNPDSDVFWGIPDAQILEPYQLELNENRTQMMKHRRLALVKWLVKRDGISPEEIEKMMSPEVAGVAQTEDDPNRVAAKVQQANVPSDLFAMDGVTMQDVREAVGFSRNQTGEFQTRRGDTSATEAAEVAEAVDIRVDERRDMAADMLTDVMREVNEIIFDRWSVEQVIEVVGPGGVPVWVRVNPSFLRKGRYITKIDPDSARPRTRQQREAKAIGVYNLLKTNPMIDPVKLTQYVLNELEGVELDTLMRALPPPRNPAQGVVDPFQFASQLQSSMGQLRSQGPRDLRALLAGAGT